MGIRAASLAIKSSGQGGFRASYFGYQYNNVRAVFQGSDPLTADNSLWGPDKDVNAIYGNLMFRIPIVLDLGIQYEQQFGSDNPLDKTLIGSGAIPRKTLEMIPLLGVAEVFYENVAFDCDLNRKQTFQPHENPSLEIPNH